MKRVLLLLGALACGLFASTCGTYRAVTNDYASDVPAVLAIKPTSGVSGEQVTFQAQLCAQPEGAAVPEYIWDFGGGAYPNTSFEAEPGVTLRDGLRSPYDGTLTLRVSCADNKTSVRTYHFSVTVAPLTVLAVTPTTGVGSGTATFSALIGTGNATDYIWDFGGAGSPGGSNVANPTITFNDVQADTLYQCRVIVSNDYEAKEFPFTLHVVPKPASP
jgi:PKD repeat protein